MGRRGARIALGLALVVSCLPGPALGQPHGISRAFYGPTAETLPRGEGYLGIYGLALPFVQMGVTDRLTIGVGSPLPMMVVGGFRDGLPYLVTGKARLFRDPRTTVSAGVAHLGLTGEGGAGFAYLVGTRRVEGGTVSVGGGCLYASYRDGRSCVPLVTLNAIGRVNDRVSVVTEVFAVPGEGAMALAGVRLGGDTFATDLGLGILIGGVLLPTVAINMSYRFGGK